MAILLHGTTRMRAEQIASEGPDPEFVEQSGGSSAESFSTCLESGPFPLGTPELYACAKSALYPSEGGAAILRINVPDDLIASAVSDFFPLTQGVVQFDAGHGLEELRLAWERLSTDIRIVECP